MGWHDELEVAKRPSFLDNLYDMLKAVFAHAEVFRAKRASLVRRVRNPPEN